MPSYPEGTRKWATYHQNGRLAYTRTMIPCDRCGKWGDHYDDSGRLIRFSSIVGTDENGHFRDVGTHGKYCEDGSIDWEFVWDSDGKLIGFTHRVQKEQDEMRARYGVPPRTIKEAVSDIEAAGQGVLF